MCNKAVNTSPSAKHSIPECYKNQEMCDKLFPNIPFMLKYCHDRYDSRNV